MALALNETLDGKYRIIRLLGEGGMGAVYEGENLRIHRKVAIKVLHSGVASSKEAVERFEREAQAAGRIGSEHIVEVLDLGQLPSGDRYMVMEFLEGESLAARIESLGRLPAPQAADLMVELLEGLGAAHDAGIIHRDLKPDNVFLLKSRRGRKDFVKLVDFGISKFSPGNGGDFSMTRTGMVMGTPYYMAPEQAKGDRATDQRADLYAAGVILYEALSGSVPFDAETYNELLFKILLETPPALAERTPGLDPRLEAIVTRAMAREPEARFQTAREFSQALTDYLQTVPAESRRSAALFATMAAPTLREPKREGQTHGAWANTNAAGPSPGSPKRPSLARSPWLWGAFAAVAVAAALAPLVQSGAASGESQNGTVQDRASPEVAQTIAPTPVEALAPAAQKAAASPGATLTSPALEATRTEPSSVRAPVEEQPSGTKPVEAGSEVVGTKEDKAEKAAVSKAPASTALTKPQASPSAKAPRTPTSPKSESTKSAPPSEKSTTSGGRVIRTTL